MTRYLPISFVTSLMLLAACERPATAPAGMAPVDAQAATRYVHRVSAGGADVVEPGYDANWSLIAFQYADGSVKGQWSDQFGHGNGGFHADVDCLNVVGKEAWVSGIAQGGDFDGRRWIARLKDNGTSANDPEDEISFSWLTFPNSQVDCHAPFPMGLMPRSGGQVTID